MKKKNYLTVLEKKILTNLDFKFLDEIKGKLPYCNSYFLVCMAETLNEFLNEEKYFDSYNEALQVLIDKSSELYLRTNISECIRNEIAL